MTERIFLQRGDRICSFLRQGLSIDQATMLTEQGRLFVGLQAGRVDLGRLMPQQRDTSDPFAFGL